MLVQEVSTKDLNEDSIESLRKKIELAVNNARNYKPKIGVFGGSGVGKSSLCNALFGKEIAAISDVAACTRKPQEILIGGESGKGGIVLVDVPGIGENQARQEEYIELYKSLVPELDLVLWAIKSDDRSYMASELAHKVVFSGENLPPVIFVVTQVDKTNPIRDWNVAEKKPGDAQQKNILLKEHEVSNVFNVSTKNIISVSSEEGFNLAELVSLVVGVLPNEKKFAFTREAKEENVSEETAIEAEKGILEYVKEIAGEAVELVKEFAVTVIIESAPKIIKALKNLFKWPW